MGKKLFRSPKGVSDILPEEQRLWQYVEKKINRITQIYGYEKLGLPVFEATELFSRGVGETTDIVEKEMYTFIDKGKNSLTLRPEFTAGVMRSYLQHGMSNLPKPIKVWSIGPVFRYERPQAGRFRQHTQFNVEALGVQDPALDLEIMSIAWQLYDELGFKNLNFQINSIGCPKCRPMYLNQLKDYYKDHMSQICDECRRRIQINPLRVLDCKNEKCQTIIENAPDISNTLCEECSVHFQKLKYYLDNLNRPYTINKRLVRGLDYYTKTVFEVWAEGIGAQNAVCGGGRYDGLAEILGGNPTPAVGFASGIERIVLTLKQNNIDIPDTIKPKIYFAYLGEKAKNEVIKLVDGIRAAGIKATMGFGSRSLKAQLRDAHKKNSDYAVIIGEHEVEKREAQIKDMRTFKEKYVPFKDIVSLAAKDEEIIK
ncbi:MAG: histidine--tRNA ligase [bacterium]